MKDLHHAPLCGRIQIDQQIAATHQIQARERRITGHVLAGEDAQVAQTLGDAVVMVLLDEEALQALRGDF